MSAGIVTAWAVEVAIVTYRDIKGISLVSGKNGQPEQQKNSATSKVAGLPLPADYLATFIVFGALSMVPQGHPASKVATYVAWGLVVASFMGLYDPVMPTKSGRSAAKGGTLLA